MKRLRGISLLIFVAFLLCACTTGMVAKPWQDMSQKERALYFVKTYNMQYEDTLAQAKRTDLTEAQKTVIRNKKEVLTHVWPMVKIYVDLVDKGGIPAPEDEAAIMSMLNSIVTLVVGKGG